MGSSVQGGSARTILWKYTRIFYDGALTGYPRLCDVRYKSICSMISAASRTNFGQRVTNSSFSSASFIPSEVLISQPSNSLHVIYPLRDLNSRTNSLTRLWAFTLRCSSSTLVFPYLSPIKHERTSHRTTCFTKMTHPTSKSSGNFQRHFTTHTELFPVN